MLMGHSIGFSKTFIKSWLGDAVVVRLDVFRRERLPRLPPLRQDMHLPCFPRTPTYTGYLRCGSKRGECIYLCGSIVSAMMFCELFFALAGGFKAAVHIPCLLESFLTYETGHAI